MIYLLLHDAYTDTPRHKASPDKTSSTVKSFKNILCIELSISSKHYLDRLLDRWHKRAKKISILLSLFALLSIFVGITLTFLLPDLLGVIIIACFFILCDLIPDYNLYEFLRPDKMGSSLFFKNNIDLENNRMMRNRGKINNIIFLTSVIFIGLSVLGVFFGFDELGDFAEILGTTLAAFGYSVPVLLWAKALSIRTLDATLRKSFAYTSLWYQIFVSTILSQLISMIAPFVGIQWFNDFYVSLFLTVGITFFVYVISIEFPYWRGSSLNQDARLTELNGEKHRIFMEKEQGYEPIMKVYFSLELERLDREILTIKNESTHLHKGVLMIPLAIAVVPINLLLTELFSNIVKLVLG